MVIDERAPGLPEPERQRRLGHARKAYFAQLGWRKRRRRASGV